MLLNTMFRPSFLLLLLLCGVKASRLDSTNNDVAKAILQIKDMIDSRLTRIESQMEEIVIRLDKLEQDDTQLLFNHQMLISHRSKDVSLTCGVVGQYESCHWEHNDHTYQVSDVLQNLHEGFEVESNTDEDQQCGIKIKSVKEKHTGSWTCNVITSSGKILSGTKDLKILPYNFEIFNNRIVRAPKKTSNQYSSDVRMSYQDSLDRCNNMGGAVPFIPRTKEDFDFMIRVVSSRLGDNWDSYMWFPATDIGTEGHLMWADGTDASDSSIIQWCKNATLQNNDEMRDCTQIGSSPCNDFVEMDYCHTDAFPLICEKLQ